MWSLATVTGIWHLESEYSPTKLMDDSNEAFTEQSCARNQRLEFVQLLIHELCGVKMAS
jgi:hypothetical protein